MTSTPIVLRKVAILREHVSRARRRGRATLEDFQADVDIQDALALSLLVALGEAGDIALHMAADEGWGVPDSLAEAFATLAKHGVISSELAHSLALVVAVRNRIAHGYASVDPARLWAELPNGLDALDQIVAAIATYMGN